MRGIAELVVRDTWLELHWLHEPARLESCVPNPNSAMPPFMLTAKLISSVFESTRPSFQLHT